ARRRKASLDGEMIEVGRKVPVEKVGRGGGGRVTSRERVRSILVTRHWSLFNSEAWLGPGSDHPRRKALDDTEKLFVGQNPVALFSALKNRVDELRPRLQAVVLEPALNVGKAAHGSHFDDLRASDHRRGNSRIDPVGQPVVSFFARLHDGRGVNAGARA